MANSDRIKIRHVCNLVKLLWGYEWLETKDSITIPARGVRYWFKTEDGVEYIAWVQEFDKDES